jgi:hypothetical protein
MAPEFRGRRRREVLMDRLEAADELWFDADVRIVCRRRRQSPTSGSPASTPKDLIREIAEGETRRFSVLRAGAAEGRANSALWTRLPFRHGRFEILEATISLSVGQAVVRVGEDLAVAQAGLLVDLAERRRAQARVEFLRDQVLHDPATAKLYLLFESRMLSGVAVSAEEIASLVKEVAKWNPTGKWMRVSELVLEFLEGQ